VDGGWRCVSPDFPPGGDCTFFFRWGRFDYIIGGFKDLWSKPAEAPDSAYEDVVRKGLDFYDGLNVPSITEITGVRQLRVRRPNPRQRRWPDGYLRLGSRSKACSFRPRAERDWE
jgi:hypothetical protein